MGQFRKGESFPAQGDDGRIHLVTTLVEYVDMAEGSGGRPQWERSGLERLRVEEDREVPALPDARNEVASCGILLQRTTPAPDASSQDGADATHRAPPTSVNGPETRFEESARLMSEFRVIRSGRFFVCLGYHFSSLGDAVAYARLMGPRPGLPSGHDGASCTPSSSHALGLPPAA